MNASFLNVTTVKIMLHFVIIKNIGRKDLRAVGGEMMISVLIIINLEFTEDIYSVTWFDCRKNES